MSAKVAINIVTWNGLRYLPELLESLDAQTYRDFVVRVIDNGSDDGTVEYLAGERPDIMLVRNVKNHGFAAAHNQAIRYALDRWGVDELADRYVLVANQDLILEPDYLEKMVSEADHHPQFGSFSGKLLRAYGENMNDEYLKETVRSDRIDTTGLRANRWRRFTDRGAGELDKAQYDEDQDVFGVSGALAFYRASALADACCRGEYFDEDFFSYKEDVDLAWRLRNLGWGALYVPQAVAYHHRGIYGKEKVGLAGRIKDRRAKRPYFAALSTRNHWLAIMKNERWFNAVLAFPLVAPLELGRICYLVIFEPRTLWVIPSAIKLAPKIISKRRETLKRTKSKASELRGWFR
ncbi:MAG: glycosyltransferase family 2 protein [Candidatus Uhrbacteria bacterium]